MAIDFKLFLSVRDSVEWEQAREWRKGKGAVSHMVWLGKRLVDGRREGAPGSSSMSRPTRPPMLSP